jgi:hypothetical protein
LAGGRVTRATQGFLRLNILGVPGRMNQHTVEDFRAESFTEISCQR